MKKINFKKKFKELEKKQIAIVRNFAPKIIEGIDKRTKSGKDLNNNSFKPYSKGYAVKKRKAFGVTKPNLFKTPYSRTTTKFMLNSMTFKKISKGARFYIKPDKASKVSGKNVTNLDKAIWNSRTRPFFRPRKRDMMWLKSKLKRGFTAVVR